ncbi:MAG: hypothetical protein IK151_05530 [Erysipelotrichaceae bacterium]|nr:hypothetical protein [Erysipelotrichaceae bacterium]
MITRNELFRAIPLFDSGLTDKEISSFSVKHKQGKGLVRYLYGYAETEEENRTMRTYIVRDNKNDEFVGYYSLKAGMISINEQRVEGKVLFDTMPGIELANFAVNDTYISRYDEIKGCGIMIFYDLIMPIIYDVSEKIGVNLIYIFSLPFDALINRYSKYGFKRLSSDQEKALHKRVKPNYDTGCIFMYQEL